MHRFFYHNPVKGYDVKSENAETLDEEYTIDMLYDTIGDEPGSFFGVISSEDVTLQFYLEDYDDRIRMEIPIPKKQGAFAKYVNFDQAIAIVKNLKDKFSPKDFPDLEFESWQQNLEGPQNQCVQSDWLIAEVLLNLGVNLNTSALSTLFSRFTPAADANVGCEIKHE